MTKSVKDEILEHIERLNAPQQQRVLDFARRLTSTEGPRRDLMRFVRTIDLADLETMSRAIRDGCEQIEPNAW